MPHRASAHVVAFLGDAIIATGTVADVANAAKARDADTDPTRPLLVFDDESSEPIELDLRGTIADVARRYATTNEQEATGATGTPGADASAQVPGARGPGRPRLGVVAREVTLLPRHWEWLATQPGGASVALRRLVEEARRTTADADRIRRAREATYRFASAMAGDVAGFEEATRALFANDRAAFATHTARWPDGVRAHARRLAERAFGRVS